MRRAVGSVVVVVVVEPEWLGMQYDSSDRIIWCVAAAELQWQGASREVDDC